MILRRIARPRAIAGQLDQLSRPSSLYQRQQHRSIHAVPPLGPSNSTAEYFSEHGVPGFLSPKTFRQTWTQYQQYLIDQINTTTTDTEYASKTPFQMHAEFSRQPERADFYNTVAMAHFNHNWWDSLSPTKKSIPESLRKDIDETFQSVENLRTEMLEHADAMFGNGFVWLMKEHSAPGSANYHTPLRILCTYNAGSPYASAWRMRQTTDSATGLDPASERMTRVQNMAGAIGPHSLSGRAGQNVATQLDAYPILCLNVWQHMYIPDYGILGKRAYLAAWWERVNWDVVQARYNQQNAAGPTSGSGLYGSR